MKRLCLFLFLVLGINITLSAGIDDETRRIAVTILGSDKIQVKKSTKYYSIIISSCKKGFVIVSNNKMPWVLGYSRESNFNEEEIPITVKEWLDKLDDEAIRRSPANTPYAISEGNIEKRTSVPPLILTHWHQSSPYNNYAPVIVDGNVRTAAGCVAIAAAQITYYWWKDNPEVTLKDTPIYPYGGAPVTYSIPKGTPNEWELIKTEYNTDDSFESRDAVARLCYVIGTTSYLNYASSTGGQISDAAKAMSSQYGLVSDFLYHSTCTQEKWDSLLYEEVSKGRPVICSGTGSSGHAFILDGYDKETNLYHFNFGWGGKGDGYYPIDDSEYSMGGYSSNQSVVYNIRPKNRNILASMNIDDVEEKIIRLSIVVKNCSTLPAEIRLLCNSSTTLSIEDTQICWQKVVNNNGQAMTYQVEIERNSSLGTVKLMLFDELGTLLCDLKQDVTNSIHNQCAENNVFKCDIQGNRVRENMKHGIYIIKEKTKYIKVLR